MLFSLWRSPKMFSAGGLWAGVGVGVGRAAAGEPGLPTITAGRATTTPALELCERVVAETRTDGRLSAEGGGGAGAGAAAAGRDDGTVGEWITGRDDVGGCAGDEIGGRAGAEAPIRVGDGATAATCVGVGVGGGRSKLLRTDAIGF